MLMSMNAYEQNQRDAKHRWGCNKGNKESKEKPNKENKSLVDQQTRLIEDDKKSKDTPTFTEEERNNNHQCSLPMTY